MTNQEGLQEFKTEALRLLAEASRNVGFDWLNKPGDLIQCRPEALRDSHGGFYFMGFNPGGSGKRSLSETIAELDIPSPAEHPLSTASGCYWPNLQVLAKCLDLSAKNLFITNLFPDCAGRVPEWQENKHKTARDYIDAIWPLHELMLSFVRPRFIVVSGMGGDSAFKLLWRKLRPDMSWDDTMSKITKEDPQVKSFSIDDLAVPKGKPLSRVTFIGVKHFSRGGPQSPSTVRKLVDHERRPA